jgi:HEAT repeat protein
MREARAEVPVSDTGPFLVDPGAWEMVRVDYPAEWTADDWMALWTAAPNAGGKSRLVSTLGEKLDALQAESWIAGEPMVDLKTRMILAAKNLTSAAMARLADDLDPRIRNAALARLAEIPNDAVAQAKLESAFRNEKSSVIRETALRGLLAGPQALVFADEAWRTPTFSMNLRVAALSHYASADPNLARTLALQQLRSPEAEPVRREAIRVLGRVKDQAGSREVLEVLIRTARERAFGPKIDALNALAAYGDAQALPLVEECAKSSSFFVREAAKAAASALRRAP